MPQHKFWGQVDADWAGFSAEKTDDSVLRLLIDYKLDMEHGLEIKFVNNNINKIRGIAET